MATVAIIVGCSDQGQGLKEVSSVHIDAKVVSSKESALEKPGLTEEKKAAIANKYGLLTKPTEPSGNFSYDLGPSFADHDITFDIKSIVGKSETEVTSLLGNPKLTMTGSWMSLSTEETSKAVRHTYRTEIGEISVKFIEGNVASIEVRPVEVLKYPADALKVLQSIGLTIDVGKAPEKESPHYLDFGRLDGLYKVRVVKNLAGDHPENIGHVYIITEDRFK
jgi:hypothetical protein